MPYTSREAGPILTPEECDVAAAVSDYSTEGTTGRDWTPIASLWRSYCDWRALYRWRVDPDAPDKLTLRQFGHAVRRIFPGVRRCKRSFHGRELWGYSGMIGPDSVVTPPARPPKGKPAHQEPASTAQDFGPPADQQRKP